MNGFHVTEPVALTSVAFVAPALAQLEQVIEQGLQTFINVGKALAQIREHRLYRELGQQTFEEYCEKRWGWTRRTGYFYIEAAGAAENVKSISHSNCPSFTQATELAKLSPEQQLAIVNQVDFSKTTVRELKERIREVQNKPVRQLAEPAPEGPEEWRTPLEIAECALRVLRTIDLIPCADASLILPANTRVEGPVEGLSVPWWGRVYLNPPCEGPVSIWVEKLCTERFEGNLTEAIAVLPAHVEADWFRLLKEYAVCFIEDRFDTNNPQKPIPFPTAVVYVGDNVTRFHEVFRGLGDIWVRWKKTTSACEGGAQ